MGWVLTPSMTRLRHGFDVIAPGRDRRSDGSIGDQAHAVEPSGHNPDESGRSELRDADNKDEVRAVDVDVDLGGAVSMQTCINAILASPQDRARLFYVIFNRTIWEADNGWRPQPYYGSDPHTNHAHFSGNVAGDEDARPWAIETLSEDVMASKDELRAIVREEVKAAIPAVVQAFYTYDPGTGKPGGIASPYTATDPKDNGTITLGTALVALLSRTAKLVAK